MTKKNARIIVDVALTVMLIAAMLIQLTGETLHEIVGALFFIGIITHLALSFKWMRGAARAIGAKRARRKTKGLVIMAALLGIDIVVLGVSSVMISRILASVGLAPALMSSLWKDIHTASSYMISALTIIHLAMHWATLFSWVRIPYNPERRAAIATGVSAVASIGVIALAANCADAMGLNPLSQDESSGTNAPTSKDETQPAPGDNRPPKPPRDSNAPQPDSAQPSKPNPSDSSSNSKDATPTGFCTLCKKHCPLSAPQCDRPYIEGLL